MGSKQSHSINRRRFLQGASVLGGGAVLAGGVHSALAAADIGEIPRRVLGKTGLQVSCLSLGTWPCGKCDTIDDQGVAKLVNEAIDLGINQIDAARAYDNAESGIARALRDRRDEVVLTTKVWADTAAEAQASFEASLSALQTDQVDVLYLHSAGDRDLDKVLASGGAWDYLLKQKKAGKAKFLGISGHCRPANFVKMINTGEVDVVLMAMNFVDRHIYGFEEKVLPAANARQMGVCCMKVFGGMRGGFGVADGADTGPQCGLKYVRQAINYSLSLPGVATLVIGVHTVEQLRENAAIVANHQPLNDQEKAALAKIGRQLAQEWGPRFGDVV